MPRVPPSASLRLPRSATLFTLQKHLLSRVSAPPHPPECPIIEFMQPTTATVAKDGQLHLAEELLCALGIPDGGEIDVILRDGCVELRKKRASTAQGIDYLPDIFHAGRPAGRRP